MLRLDRGIHGPPAWIHSMSRRPVRPWNDTHKALVMAGLEALEFFDLCSTSGAISRRPSVQTAIKPGSVCSLQLRVVFSFWCYNDVLSRTHAGAEIRARSVIHPPGKRIFVFAGWEEEKETLTRPI